MISNNTLKDKLKNKKLTIGSWLSFGYTPVVEMMAKSNFEWLVIDMEHTGISDSEMFQMIQIIDLAGKIPLVRVGKNDELLIKKALDAGAYGVVVPMVNNKEDAQKVVAYAKYPPVGQRGVGLFRAHKYGIGFDEYKKWAEKNTIVIVQIEHIKAVENLEEIMSVENIDGFIIGPYDLSASMGLPGDFENRSVVNVLEEVNKFVKESSKPGGFHVVHSDIDLLKQKITEGYTFIAYGDDMVLFAEKLKSEKNKLLEIL